MAIARQRQKFTQCVNFWKCEITCLAVFQQDRKDLFRNVPFQNVACEDAICRFASHLSFAFWVIVYQKPELKKLYALVFHCLDSVSHISLNCPLFRLDHLLPQLLPLCGEPVLLRGRARRIGLRHLDKAEFD